ncbi:MAG: NAD(P)H-dependent oxidoreductase [Flavobacteriia bacterium]|nr:NAD(P)H-dependent oxidoreductase [Flavobacteriia bacterium]
MKHIIEALEWRYAVKKFDDQAVLSQLELEGLKQAFNLSASSYGLQPYELMVVTNKEIQSQMSALAFGQAQPTQAAAVLVFCVKTNFSEQDIEQYFELIASQRETAPEALEGYKNFMKGVFSQKTQTEILDWATKQVYLSMGTLLSACASMGIDSCPMEGFDPKGIDSLLDLNTKNLQSVLLMPVGKRATDDAVSQLNKVRKPLEDLVTEVH